MPDDKTFTREQVSELMRKRVERSHQSFFKRYGVKDLSELDALFDKANSTQELQSRIDALQGEKDELATKHQELTKKYALKVLNIDPNKVGDVEAHFKGKGLDIDETSLGTELQSHPDWVAPNTGIQEIGSETVDEPDPDANERAIASQIFGVEF